MISYAFISVSVVQIYHFSYIQLYLFFYQQEKLTQQEIEGKSNCGIALIHGEINGKLKSKSEPARLGFAEHLHLFQYIHRV